MNKFNILKLSLPIIFILNQNILTNNTNSIHIPYNLINILKPDMHGWFSPENKEGLKYFINTFKPKCIVELGSWLGLSAIFMAKLIDNNAKIYAIDNWTAEGDISILSTPGMKEKLPTLYQQFLSNVIYENVCNKIIPVRMNTIEAAQSLNIIPDLIYIDASHDEISVYNDIKYWYPKLKKGGIMCGDDWMFESVRNALNKVSKELEINIINNGNFWHFTPNKK